MDGAPGTMTRDAFRRWAMAQPSGRYERINGRVVRMTPERIIHVVLKTAMWQALHAAIRTAAIQAQAYGDGVTVEADAHTDMEPDASVNLGPPPPAEALALPNPVIVVEVLSPGTRSVDTTETLDGYFRVPSNGTLALDPPGLAVPLDAIYAESGL